MTPSLLTRRPAAALLAVALGLAALTGCGGSSQPPAKKDEKKDEPKPGEPNPSAPGGTTPNGSPSGAAPKDTLKPVDPDAQKAEENFIKALNDPNTAPTIDALSTAFKKVVGKPLVFQGDKDNGFSADAAADWLRKVREGRSFNAPLAPDQAGDVVYSRGLISMSPQLGSYSLRLVKENGAWKVDWLTLTSVTPPDSIQKQIERPQTVDGVSQGFAVAAFTEAVTDLNAMPEKERMVVLAAALTPALREAWGPPFDQDKSQGYNYNWLELARKAAKVGGGTTAFTAAREGDRPEFKLVLTKPAGKKTYLLKLKPGTAPHEWLVNEVTEVTEAKG
jgi:hypothetical protein